jgi:hypothetical protein
MAEITEQLGTEAREEHKQQVAQQVQEREQRDAQEQKARDEHDARMAQLPGLVQQSVQQAQAAIAPMQPGSLSPRAGQPKSQPQPAGNVGAAPLPGAQPATVATASGASAAAQAALQKCLSEPVTHTTTTRTNPFPSYQQTFQSLLAKARQGCAAATTWSAWQGCIGDNATGALWSFEGPAASDQAALALRYGGVAIFFSGTSCLWGNIKGTRADCTTAAGSLAVVRNLCTTRLQADIDMMSCDAAMLPGVWSAEDARSDADAKKKHDASCYATSGK